MRGSETLICLLVTFRSKTNRKSLCFQYINAQLNRHLMSKNLTVCIEGGKYWHKIKIHNSKILGKTETQLNIKPDLAIWVWLKIIIAWIPDVSISLPFQIGHGDICCRRYIPLSSLHEISIPFVFCTTATIPDRTLVAFADATRHKGSTMITTIRQKNRKQSLP